MPQASWQADADGSYWIDIAVGNQEVRALVDLGMIDAADRVGLALETPLYDAMKLAGEFSAYFADLRLDASGAIRKRENGATIAQLIDPVTRLRIGPKIRTFASRGYPGVPHRVSVVFFHQLTGCQVLWKLDQREWTITYP